MTGTTVDHLVAVLRHDILSGSAEPGQPLREERLAERFAVSRHTVRQALARLGATGLVRTLPYRGTAVTTFDFAQVVALQDLRRALESEAVRLVVERHGPGAWPTAVLTPIEDAITRLAVAERAATVGDAAAWLAVQRAHTGVHRSIVEAARSDRITATHRLLSDELDLLMLHAKERYRPGELLPQHRALVEALQRRGPAAMVDHLDDTVARLFGAE